MSVLEGACVDIFMDPVEDLVPFPLVLLYRDGLLLGQVAAGFAAGDVVLAPTKDGFKMYLYYYDQNSGVLGGYSVDCIKK